MTSITLEAANLAKLLNEAKGLAKRDTATPIIANALVTTSDGTISVKTSNYDQEIVLTAPLDAPECQFCVDAQRFAAIVSALPAGAQVKIDVGDAQVSVSSGRAKFRLATLPVDSFPVLPFTGDQAFDAPASLFEALAIARPAASSRNGAQYWLDGVFVGDRDGATWIAGTDSNHMIAVKLDPLGLGEMIVPNAAVELIAKIDGECKVTTEDGRIRFDFGDTVITSKLIEGQYPAFARIIPADDVQAISFDADDAAAALNRIALVAEDKDRTVLASFADGAITFTNRSHADQGVEEVPCDYTGEPFSGAFRLGYLRSALAAVDADTVKWHVTGEFNPTKIINPARPAVVTVVMPTR